MPKKMTRVFHEAEARSLIEKEMLAKGKFFDDGIWFKAVKQVKPDLDPKKGGPHFTKDEFDELRKAVEHLIDRRSDD